MRLPALPAALAGPVTMAVLLSTSAHAAELTPAPMWKGQTLLGPARGAATLVGATFTYNAQTKKLRFRLGTKSLEMTVGSKSATANGATRTLSEAPRSLNSSTYVPLKSLFTSLGFQVHPQGQSGWVICTDTKCILLKVPPRPQ